MNKRRATFTIDAETETALPRTADRLSESKIEVVHKAIQDDGARVTRLSKRERLRLLAAFDEHVPRIPERPLAEVESELEQIRRSRRAPLLRGRPAARP